jgi:hypothetical protein
MRMRRLTAATSLVGLLALSACAWMPGAPPPVSSDAPAGQSLGSLAPAPPAGEVVGTGTVMDRDGEAQFCLGPVAESYPPQCSGIPHAGWSWDRVEGSESSGDARWGSYALTGTYDGTTFTTTAAPILLALYDPLAPADPTGGESGIATDDELVAIQDELPTRLSGDGMVYLASYPQNGRLWVDVLWDDGTLQQAADDDFGDGTVIIRSALREVGG